MRRLLREPLVHFLVLGALLFAGYAVLNRGGAAEPGRIVISRGQLAAMMEGFTRVRQRPPTGEEWDGLIRARVREEVLYREALALGLDKDDTIIRRRLQQKMEFLFEDVAAQAQPTDADLAAYLDGHPGDFRLEPRFTFRQLFLDPDKHRGRLEQDSVRLLARLQGADGGVDVAALGDSLMLGNEFNEVAASEVERQFGEEFATAVGDLPLGEWRGPVESAYGKHLIFVSGRAEARLPALAEVRDAVRREWEDSRRLAANERYMQELLAHYRVTIEEPAAPGERAAASGK